MFGKLVQVGLVVVAVVVAYLVLTIAMPVLTDSASSANLSIAASSNVSDYPGMQGALVGSPLWLYFVPAGIGMVVIIIILAKREVR